MAITQISKIQVRRGLQEELGQLASGELAWAIDTQRLFIGNGTLDEGAPVSGITQIYPPSTSGGTTDFGLYIYSGLVQSGYTANTGVTERLVQAKFDDIIDVHDFGARGTGNGDDYEAIQRCFDEVYNKNQGGVTPQRTRRAVKFTGGKYNISQTLRIPPYLTILGDGMNSVVINYNGSTVANCVMRATTNLGQYPSDTSTITYEDPNSIYIHGVTFSTSSNIDILHIDSATQCKFEQVKFTGPMIEPIASDERHSCVSVTSAASETTNIVFRDCEFSKLSIGVNISATINTEGIVFDNCLFKEVWQGITAGGTPVPKSIKISNSRFVKIADSAIVGETDVESIVSVSNTFIDCGNYYAGDNAYQAAVVPVIVFNGNNNYSISDIFGRNLVENQRVSRVSANGHAVISTSIDDGLALGDAHFGPGTKFSVINNSMRTTVIPKTQGIINYSVSRGGIQRSGTIKFAPSPTTGKLVYDEEYVENDDAGVSLNLTSVAGGSQLAVTTSNMGYDTVLTFDVKSLY